MTMFNGTATGAAAMINQALEKLDEIANNLALLVEAADTRIDQIAVTDVSAEPGLQKDFPTLGSQRWILNRTPDGRELECPAGEKIEAIPANVNRLGGRIVNHSEKPLRIYLARLGNINAGTATITLEPKENWNFMLGNLLWSGTVTVEAIGGICTLSITEV